MINGYIVATYKNTTTNEWDYELLSCENVSIGSEVTKYEVVVHDSYVIVSSRGCTDDNSVEDDITDTINQIISDTSAVMGHKTYSNIVRIPRYFYEI